MEFFPFSTDAAKQGKTKEKTNKLNEWWGNNGDQRLWELAVALADLLRNGCELKDTNVWDHYLATNLPLCRLGA